MSIIVMAMLMQAGASYGPAIRYAATAAPRARTVNARCDAPADPDGDIVVCARRLDQRLPTLDDARYAPKKPIAAFRLAGADGRVTAEQRGLPGGLSGQAAMVHFTWRFGKSSKH